MTSPEASYNFRTEERLYNAFYKFSEIQDKDIRFVIPSETVLWPLIPTNITTAIERFGDQEIYARLPMPNQAKNDPYRLPVVYIKIDENALIAASYIVAHAEFEKDEFPFRTPCRNIIKIFEQNEEYEEVLRLINPFWY